MLAVACNIAEATKECVKGALAFVINFNFGSGGESAHVRARSRNGRWIQKWERIHRLCNFRVKTIPPAHPRYEDEYILFFSVEDKQWPTDLAQWYTGMAEKTRAHRVAEHRGDPWKCGECSPQMWDIPADPEKAALHQEILGGLEQNDR